MQEVIAGFKKIHPISPELELHLYKVTKSRTIGKKEFLLQEGEIDHHIYFVKKGLLRAFNRDDDNVEITSWFLKETDVIISVESFYTQRPSMEFIEALEDSELYVVTYQQLQYMYDHFPEFNYIGRVITEKYNLLLIEYNRFTKIKPVQARYKYFLTNFPELVQRVSNRDVASFLGISEAHLSTVKGKV